LKRKKLKMP